MTYDPNKVEDWVVGSSNFWRKGEANANQFFVPFTGTWNEVNARMEEMREMANRHARERDALSERQAIERKTLWP